MLKFQSPVLFTATTDGDIADNIGDLRAKAKEISDQIAFFEGLLKHKGVEVAEGKRFRVTIAYGVEQRRPDWKAIALKLNALPMLIDLYTKVTTSDRVRVTAHTKRS
jgi:hypothetical protein